MGIQGLTGSACVSVGIRIITSYYPTLIDFGGFRRKETEGQSREVSRGFERKGNNIQWKK